MKKKVKKTLRKEVILSIEEERLLVYDMQKTACDAFVKSVTEALIIYNKSTIVLQQWNKLQRIGE